MLTGLALFPPPFLSTQHGTLINDKSRASGDMIPLISTCRVSSSLMDIADEIVENPRSSADAVQRGHHGHPYRCNEA
jgi:hypothetical protein